MPAEVATLAGTQDALAVTRSTGLHDERIAVTERHVGKVDQQEVREAETGAGEVISRGRKVKVKVFLTKIDAATRETARGLTRPRPAGALAGNPAPSQVSAGTVASRELPGPDQPPQDHAPPGRPPAGLDPPGPGKGPAIPAARGGQRSSPASRPHPRGPDA
jgi:hypothetical protein